MAFRDYEDYVPNTEIVQEEDCDTLLISLPGFMREQLRVQLTPTRMLKVSGERPIGGNKWIRFQKEYPISTNCETNQITARFDVGILHIRQPKLITPVVQKDEEKPEHETQDTQKKETEPQPPLPQTSQKNETEPQPPLPPTTEMKNGYEQKDETKSGAKMEDESKVSSKSNGADDGDITQKSREEEKEPRKGGVENNGKRKEEDEDKVASKTNGADDGDMTQKSREEEKEPRKGGVENNGKRKKDDEVTRGELMTGRVEMAKKLRRMMIVVVVVLSVLVLGVYVKNLIMPTKNYEK